MSDGRCLNCAGHPRQPAGFTREASAGHPTYRHYMTPGARCELEADHDGAHRSGLLLWHDPPLFITEVRAPLTRDRTVSAVAAIGGPAETDDGNAIPPAVASRPARRGARAGGSRGPDTRQETLA